MKKIQVYGYNPLTFQKLQGDFYADESPLEPGIFLLPQYTTQTKPPEELGGFVLRYDVEADEWSHVRHWGDSPLFLTATGEPYQLDAPIDGVSFDGFGPLPDWLADKERPSAAFDWDVNAGDWIEDEQRAIALAAEQAQAREIAAIEDVRNALQDAIDAKARGLGFSGGNALMLYAGFENAFKVLAQQFGAWEAQVWVEAGAYKAQVQSGDKPMVSGIEAVLMMPEYPTKK